MCVDQNQRFSMGNKESRVVAKKSFDKVIKLKKLPRRPVTLKYDINSLHWDNYHRSNNESIYCYCGTGGDWFSQMLQCARCQQWFHHGCISCLKYPVYTGDRFYFFVCSVCNYGSEFIRRLELDWVDLVHLMIFNLTAYNSKKYYDLEAVIIPYIMDNWHALQLPKKMQIISPNQRKEKIFETLTNNRNRFKCGKEIKKRATIWGLRIRAPPQVNTYTGQPPSGPLTEQMISAKWNIISEPDSPTSSASNDRNSEQGMIVDIDTHWISTMMGKRFQCSINSDNDSMRSTPSPTPDLKSSTASFYSSRTRYSNENKERNTSPYSFREDPPVDEQPSTSVRKAKKLKFFEMDYQGGGFIKKTVPFPKLSLSKRTKILSYMSQKRDKSDDDELIDLEKNKKFAKTRTILRNTIPDKNEAEKDDGKSYCKSSKLPNITKSVSNSPHDEINLKREEFLPPTPPTSVSNPPTPPASTTNTSNENRLDFNTLKTGAEESNSSTKAKDEERLTAVHERLKTPEKNKTSPTRSHTRRVAAMNLEISKLSTKNIIEHSKIMSLHHNDAYSLYAQRNAEHDSSDDTSSRGTLDAIIPPPVNFQGKNNPFHQQSSCTSKAISSITIANKKGNYSITNKTVTKSTVSVTGNSVLGPVIRPLKRQLSEKDLIIGPNGEIKRKRLRRPRKKELQKQILLKDAIAGEKQRTLRSSLGQEDSNGDAQINTSLGENSRCLRQRTEKNYCDGRRSSTSSMVNFQPTNGIPVSTVPSTGVKSLNLSPHKSPFKTGPTSSMATRELKTSVFGYFGAVNRITAGEKFSIIGKRMIDNGKTQFLIEWDGHCS